MLRERSGRMGNGRDFMLHGEHFKDDRFCSGFIGGDKALFKSNMQSEQSKGKLFWVKVLPYGMVCICHDRMFDWRDNFDKSWFLDRNWNLIHIDISFQIDLCENFSRNHTISKNEILRIEDLIERDLNQNSVHF